MRTLHKSVFAIAPLAGWLLPVNEASACSACFGKSNDAMFFSYYVGAFTLIGVVASVFVGIVAFAIHMNRRARAAAPEVSATPN